MLQFVAVCCSALQCVAVWYSVLLGVAVCCKCCSIFLWSSQIASRRRAALLQCAEVCCIALQCVAVCCSVFQCVAVCCSALQGVAVCCSVLQGVAVCCSVLQCVAVCCSALQGVAVFWVGWYGSVRVHERIVSNTHGPTYCNRLWVWVGVLV